MRLNVANNFETFLTAGITDSDTTMTVDDSTGAPDTPFRLRIDELELVQVNVVDGNEYTIERGAEGTAPVSHSIGSKVELTWTAGVKESMDEELDAVDEDLQSHKADNANKAHGGFQGALLRKTSNQSIASETPTVMSWGEDVYDTANVADIANNGFTIPAGVSKVKVGLNLEFSANALGDLGAIGIDRFEVFTQVNGSIFRGAIYDRIDGFNYSRRKNYGCSSIFEVSEGDLITASIRQDRGQPIDVINAIATWFSLEVIE